jgi:hypothetical protein
VTEVHPHVEQRAGINVVRVGRKPDPLAFVPMQHQTWAGRFDDPDRLWRTLYTASDEHGAWLEVLGRFRAHPDTQAALDDIIEEPGDALRFGRSRLAPNVCPSRGAQRRRPDPGRYRALQRGPVPARIEVVTGCSGA